MFSTIIELRINYTAPLQPTASLIFYALLDIFIVMDPEPDITTMEF